MTVVSSEVTPGGACLGADVVEHVVLPVAVQARRHLVHRQVGEHNVPEGGGEEM